MKYLQDGVKPYGEGDKKEQVENMFDHIAPAYDSMNHLMTMGIDGLWRNKAIGKLSGRNVSTLLDVASGTGDFAINAYRKLKPRSILCVDISEGMMNVGREKVKSLGLEKHISFEKQDCMALSLPDDSFDAITVAFGIRNFTDLEKGLSEMYRVLKPCGCVVILELSRPEMFLVRQLYDFYAKHVIPFLGSVMSHDKKAYEYLPKSIAAFPQSREVTALMGRIGYRDAAFKKLTFGVCTMYYAYK